jgi:hypothetical protein
MKSIQQQLSHRTRGSATGDGVDFVRCRICGDHRRVVSGRHLSKHSTDRERYMAEYRLSPDELIAKDFRIIQSSRPGYQPYGKREWVAAIKRIYKRNNGVSAGLLQKSHPYLYNQGVWIFGDADEGLRAAGFDPETTRLRSFWKDERLNREIQRLRQQKLPLYGRYVMKNHPKVFSQALRRHGTWEKALMANQITRVPRRFRLHLLVQLRDVMESGKEISKGLRSEIDYYFGSLQNAKLAVKTDKRLLNGWSKRKIVTVLVQKHRSQEKLDYATGRREFPALVSAAEAYFGSWGKALYAAGIDPTLYFVHHTWRKPRPRLETVQT